MNKGSAHFQSYVRNINRINWCEFIDLHTNGPRLAQMRPFIVDVRNIAASQQPVALPRS